MNSKREYFIKSFHWKKCMHFVVVFIICLTLTLLLLFLKWNKDPKTYTSKRIASDFTFIIGITIFSYTGLAYIISMGFVFSSFKKNKYQRADDITQKIEQEKSKPFSKERDLRIKILNDELKSEKEKMDNKSKTKKYNFVLVILLIISIILLISALCLNRLT
ncbi:DUF3899 domain-containing protein [Mycoplasmopsis primatum]|uniref:DUF3899 domain-containing protein n=1 Tax=Mycoplasmopsis primatum TaxID=55604 RepID=UPI000495ED4D|nr:DUF3899 domain-containing protein [Mycoplasmopsis primatum]